MELGGADSIWVQHSQKGPGGGRGSPGQGWVGLDGFAWLLRALSLRPYLVTGTRNPLHPLGQHRSSRWLSAARQDCTSEPRRRLVDLAWLQTGELEEGPGWGQYVLGHSGGAVSSRGTAGIAEVALKLASHCQTLIPKHSAPEPSGAQAPCLPGQGFPRRLRTASWCREIAMLAR